MKLAKVGIGLLGAAIGTASGGSAAHARPGETAAVATQDPAPDGQARRRFEVELGVSSLGFGVEAGMDLGDWFAMAFGADYDFDRSQARIMPRIHTPGTVLRAYGSAGLATAEYDRPCFIECRDLVGQETATQLEVGVEITAWHVRVHGFGGRQDLLSEPICDAKGCTASARYYAGFGFGLAL